MEGGVADRATIIAKIRKCLALSSSANEHEAAAAMAKARELMDEHNISATEMSFADINEASARGSGNLKCHRWEVILANAIGRAFECAQFHDSDLKRRFVGFDPAPEIAGYAFDVLFRQCRRARKTYIEAHLRRCKPATKRRRADIFCMGWTEAIYAKARALHVSPERKEVVNQYLVERHPGLVAVDPRSTKKRLNVRDSDAFWRGFSNGRSASLHGGVNGATGVALLNG